MKKGVFAVVLSSFLYGIMPIFTKRVLMDGMPGGAVVFYRLFFSAVLSLLILLATKEDMAVTGEQFTQLAVFGVLGFGATTALLAIAYDHIPTGLATMLHFTYPLFVTVVMTVIFKEKLSKFKVLSCLFAIAGLAFMADFSSLALTGLIAAVASGITYAGYVIANKKSSFASLPGMVIIFYVNSVAAVIFGIKAVFTKEFMLPANFKQLGLLLVIALFCTIISMYLLNYGIKTLGASTAAVLNMLEPVVSLFAGIIIYKEAVGIKGLIGAALVVIGGIIVAFDGGEEKVKVHINTQRYK